MNLKQIINHNQIRNSRFVLYALSFIGVLSLIWWLMSDPSRSFNQSLPGLDKRSASNDLSRNQVTKIGENFTLFGTLTSTLTGTWPRFRGENFDNISKSTVPLTDKIGDIKKRIRWSVNLGEGHAGASIWKGAVYILDYDEAKRSDMLRCFSLVEGKELWRRWYKVNIKRNHGMSRTVSAVTEKYILSMGPRCHVMCVDRANGNFKWGIDVEKEYNSEVPLWYTGQCSLIDGSTAIIATGGKALMIAVDCETGKKLWETPNPKKWKMSHSSVMPYVLNGRKMYVYSAIGGVFGVAADGPDAGKVLWESSAWNHNVIAPSAVCMPDGKIFLTAGYGAGSMMLQLKSAGNKFEVKVLEEYAPKDGLACEQQTPLFYKGHLFGILPKDGGTLRNQMVCVSPSNPKKMVWSSGKTTRFGLGPFIIADNKLFILSDEGELTIARPSTSSFEILDHAKVIDGQDAWAPLALADGYLVLRDSKKMFCLDMRK